MNYIRITDGKIDGAIVKVQPGFVLDPALVPVVDDPVPAFSSATHKARFGDLVVESGGSWVRRPWVVEPLTPEELANDAELAEVKDAATRIAGAIKKLKDGTATAAERNQYLLFALIYIHRQLKEQGQA